MPGSMPARRRRSSFGLPGAGAPTAPGNSPKGCLPALPVLPYISGISPGTCFDAWRSRFDGKSDSYVCGVADAPLLGDTIGRSLDLAARRWADREALVSPSHGVRWTWKELNARVDALAAGLLALGLERGARIGVWSLNRPEWTLTQFAAAKAGLILVTINPAYRLSELEFALAKVGCAAIVTATAFKTSNYMEMLNTLLPELAKAAPGDLHAARLPQLRSVIQIGGPACPGTIPFEEVARTAAHATATRSPRSARPCSSTIPSISSLPAAPPDRPRASR